MFRSAFLCYAVLCYDMLIHARFCDVVKVSVVLGKAMLCYVTICYAMLRCAMCCSTLFFFTGLCDVML